MNEPFTQVVRLEPPFASRRLLVEFYPVRGSIKAVRGATPSGVHVAVVRPLAILVMLPGNTRPTTPVELTIEVIGEPVHRFEVGVAPEARPGVGSTDVASPRDWLLLYHARAAMTDPKQVFFFELERMTNIWFLEHAPDVPTQEKQRRAKLLTDIGAESIITQLTNRLRSRYSESERPLPLNSRDDAKLVSGIFRDATRKLACGDDWDAVGEAMLEFAAGHLMQNVVIDTTDHQNRPIRKNIIVTAPDSFYIFFYAEFALAAMELGVDADMWGSLIPYLCDMQPIYIARFEQRPGLLRDYHGIPKHSAGLLAGRRRSPHDDWNAVMRENVRLAAPMF